MTELRDYQIDVVEKWRQTMADGKRRVIVVAPTGAGKTHIAAAVIKDAVSAGQRVLVLAHRREILLQTASKLIAHGVDHGLIQAGEAPRLGKAVQVASIPTLWSWAMRTRRIAPPPADLLVVDECHHAPARTWQKIIASYPGVPLIGLTATPCRSDGRGLGGIFDAIVECPQVAELIEHKHLVRTRTYAPVDPDLKGAQTRVGDYAETQLAERMDRDDVIGRAGGPPTATQGVAGSLGLGPISQHRLGEGSGEGGCGVSGKRSVWKQRPDGKTVRRNSIAQHFASRPVELLESPVLRILSQYGHLALLGIELELRRHGGHDNGKLIVTTRQFVEYGIERRQIPAALRELEALGIVIVTHGRGGNAEHRKPNRFLLNYLCGAVNTRDEITNAWKRIETMEQAEQIARSARAAKDENRVARSRRIAGRKKHFPGTKPVPGARYQTSTVSVRFPGTEPVPPGLGTEPVPPFDISDRRGIYGASTKPRG